MNLEILLPLIISVIGAGVSVYTVNRQQKKLTAETKSIEAQGNTAIVGTALTLIEPLEARIKSMDLRIIALESQLQAEQEANAKLKLENENLKAALNVMGIENASLKQRIARLEQRVGTGDLTPPPHDIPNNTTPTPPTRDNWQEPPPIDEPPNE